MKNYEEVAESVFKRSEEMIALNKKRRRDRLINIGATVGCLAVAGAVGIGVWKTAGRPDVQVVSDIYQQSGANAAQSSEQSDNNGQNISENYYIFDRYIPFSTSSNDGSGTESSEVISSSAVTSTDESIATSTDSSVTNSEISGASDIVFPAFSESEPVKVLTVIEEYGAADTIPDSVPENGAFLFSDALKGAMEEYGYTDENGDIRYRVAVDFYDNGEIVDVDLPAIREIECQRLTGCGYQCHFETCTKEWGNIVDHHFCMMLTREQLENFPPCENYGCTFHLYGERHCILLDGDDTTSSDYVPPAQNQGCHHGWGGGNGNGYGNGYGNGNGYGYGHHGGHC